MPGFAGQRLYRQLVAAELAFVLGGAALPGMLANVVVYTVFHFAAFCRPITTFQHLCCLKVCIRLRSPHIQPQGYPNGKQVGGDRKRGQIVLEDFENEAFRDPRTQAMLRRVHAAQRGEGACRAREPPGAGRERDGVPAAQRARAVACRLRAPCGPRSGSCLARRASQHPRCETSAEARVSVEAENVALVHATSSKSTTAVVLANTRRASAGLIPVATNPGTLAW